MRLSDAIMLGCTISPQGRIGLKNENGSTCALGAALEAIGKSKEAYNASYSAVYNEWPILNAYAAHPLTNISQRIISTIISLNDDWRWTREQIAAWVRSIEPQDAPDDGLAAGAEFEKEGKYMEVGV